MKMGRRNKDQLDRNVKYLVEKDREFIIIDTFMTVM